MRALLATAVLLSAATPVFATPVLTVPEPESIALMALAAVAAFVAHRRKK
ncbi:MAG: PEP-CTERM sorting domain-containing protein [Candidatus Accumulibacter meliphilus]|jgi:hypothetical protein|uniref:PEP-CTERM sorting domain-containing protein n=1 Tax=Candidatus Accumulibacter meliphilus TaxID=2211374 RepID=A0A369XQ74_9PROT|nr:MAG: PEP-CTERM sorting domain-containing protein [Candidatus Accumulibacter meliphilus]